MYQTRPADTPELTQDDRGSRFVNAMRALRAMPRDTDASGTEAFGAAVAALGAIYEEDPIVGRAYVVEGAKDETKWCVIIPNRMGVGKAWQAGRSGELEAALARNDARTMAGILGKVSEFGYGVAMLRSAPEGGRLPLERVLGLVLGEHGQLPEDAASVRERFSRTTETLV